MPRPITRQHVQFFGWVSPWPTAYRANSIGSGETARIRRLARTFAARIYFNVSFLMMWIISIVTTLAINRGCNFETF